MDYRKLTSQDSTALWELINITVESLGNPEFWLPIDDETREHLFDPEWTILYGAFDGPKLVGAAGLFLNPKEYSESVSYMSMKFEAVAKIDRLMVHPGYIGRGISAALTRKLFEEAKRLDRKTLIATIHPQNTWGKNVMTKVGMELQCAYMNKDGYFRNVYVITAVGKKKGLFGFLGGGKK